MPLSLTEKRQLYWHEKQSKRCVWLQTKQKRRRAQIMKGEFESLNMKETEQIDDFYMKLNGLVTNIRALKERCGSDLCGEKTA